MAFTAFNHQFGQSQGRIPAPDNGEFSFVLGDTHGECMHALSIGDFAQIDQETDLTAMDLLRVSCKMCVPVSSMSWELSIVVDGVKLASTNLGPGTQRDISDFGANVSKISGIHTVGVRLKSVNLP